MVEAFAQDVVRHAIGVPATAAAHGIKSCIANLEMRGPHSQIVVVKTLPVFDPEQGVGKEVHNVNCVASSPQLARLPQVNVDDF